MSDSQLAALPIRPSFKPLPLSDFKLFTTSPVPRTCASNDKKKMPKAVGKEKLIGKPIEREIKEECRRQS